MISLKYGDNIKMIGEHPGGHQSCQAPADDHRMLAKAILHHASPFIRESPQQIDWDGIHATGLVPLDWQ
jgi:hypothetical protein